MRALFALPIRRLWALVRPNSENLIATRLAVRLGLNGEGLRGREGSLVPISGDVSRPLLGLCPADAEAVLKEVDVVIHCAASTSFVRGAECRETNVQGMERLIAFCRDSTRKPLVVYVSTAANCGDIRGQCLAEVQGGHPDAMHYNEYTRTKAQAEQLLRQSELPSLIVRPSIVLSAGLAERRFAMNILWCLPLLNLLGAAPIHPASRLDFVTIEFVVESILRLLLRPRLRHQCYHISAGETGSITARRITEFLDGFYGRSEPIQLFPQSEWTSAVKKRFVQTHDQRAAAMRLRPYLPFMNMNTVFDNRRLVAELAHAMPHNPDPLSYMGTLLRQFSLADALTASRNP